MTLNSIRTHALNVGKTVCHITTRKYDWIRCLNVSTLLHEKCLVSANKCLDCGQQPVKQNKKVASNNNHCFLKIIFNLPNCAFFFTIGTFRKLRKATISFPMSVLLSAWSNSAPTGQIFMKFDIWEFFENCRENSSFI
jgi:hypothetical protein